jgi:hypothetical protein
MPTERLSIRHIRKFLRLHYSVGMSQRVARSLNLAQGTVSMYVNRAIDASTWFRPHRWLYASSSSVGGETVCQSKANTCCRSEGGPSCAECVGPSVSTSAVNDGRPLRQHQRITRPKGAKRESLAP